MQTAEELMERRIVVRSLFSIGAEEGRSWTSTRAETKGFTRHFFLRYLSHVCVESHLSESNLSKKGDQKTRIYDISHFATKVCRCSESNLICLSQIWVKKGDQKPNKSIQILLLILFLIKWTLLAIDSDCLPKVCYLKLKKLRYLSKLR